MSTRLRFLQGYKMKGLSTKRPRVLHLPSLRDSWCQPSEPSALLSATPLSDHERQELHFVSEFTDREWTALICEMLGVPMIDGLQTYVTRADGHIWVEVVGLRFL